MDIIKIVFICISSLILIILLRRMNSDYALFVSCAINLGITVFSILIIVPVLEYAKGISNQTTEQFSEIMFKSAGICLLCSIASEMCGDAGETQLSSKIEFAGKCTLLAYCLPLIKKVFEYATGFIN